VRSARLPTHLLILRAGYFKYLASVKWRAAIWQSTKDTTSRRERRRSSNNQCKHRTSGSTQFYKAIAKPASKHQRRSPAHITSYPGAESAFYERNPVNGRKQDLIDYVQRKSSLNSAPSARGTFPSNNVRLEGI